MKVLFLESYFKPEKTSGAHLAEDMRKELIKRGHSLYVYAPTPTRGIDDDTRKKYIKLKHETDFDGALKIHRFSLFGEGKNTLLRAFRYCILELRLLVCALFCEKADLIPMGSTPPINGILTTIVKKIRKIPFVYTVQDMFPESLVSTGMTREGSLLYKIGSWVSNLTYKNASHIIVITQSMKDALVKKGVADTKITVIPNWIDTDEVIPVERAENQLFDEFGLDRDSFYVTYAGNIGNSQNVELLAECAKRLYEHSDIKFVIFGDGSQKDKLESFIKDNNLDNIYLFPMQPKERISEVYSLGNVSFVICKKGVGKGAFPSKAATIMATGTSIIASFDEDSELCRVVTENELGICVPPEDSETASRAILDMYENNLCAKYGENGRKAAKELFSKEINLAKRIKVYEDSILK